MTKKERQAHKKGAIEMLLSIAGISIWVIIIIAYGYMKFM